MSMCCLNPLYWSAKFCERRGQSTHWLVEVSSKSELEEREEGCLLGR